MAKETEVGPRGKEAPKKVSRREFVKGAAVGAAGIAAAGALASCAPAATPTTAPVATPAPAPTCAPAAECPPCATPWIPSTWDEEADLVVCGYGAAGMPAAIEAHDAGADVLIIEKLAEGGGSLRRSGGGIQGVNTVVQKALGVVDLGPDDLYGFMVAAGQGLTNPALLRVVADNCGPNVDWLIEDLGGVMPYEVDVPEIPTAEATPGLRYSHNSAEQFGYALIPRAHFMTPATERWMGGMDCPTMPGYGGGTGLFKPFDDAIKARAIRTMTETALIELVATPDREVLGVKALSQGKTLYIKAKKGVFLATSGMTNNEQMIRTYVPSRIGRTTAVHALMSHGEGIIAGHAIGADLYGMANPGTGTDAAGGLAINPKAQVIDVFGNVIPRLYAGGMVVGGLYYDIDWQGGSHVACAVCFGRIGGRNAAQEEPWA